MPSNDSNLSSLLATSVFPGILRETDAKSARDVEDFFGSRLCEQIVDEETGMWQLGCTALAQAYRMELAGIDYQEARELA